MTELTQCPEVRVYSFKQNVSVMEQLQIDTIVEAMDASVEIIENGLETMQLWNTTEMGDLCLAIWDGTLILRSIDLGLDYNGNYQIEQMSYVHTINSNIFLTFELRLENIYIGIGLTNNSSEHVLKFDISRKESIGEIYHSRVFESDINPFISVINSTIMELTDVLYPLTRDYLNTLSDEQKEVLINPQYRKMHDLVKLVARNYEGN